MTIAGAASVPVNPADCVSNFARVPAPETVAQPDNTGDQLDLTKTNAQMDVRVCSL